MDKVIKEMEENKNIIIEGKFVYELEQQLQRLKAENYELKESLKVFNRPDVKKVLTDYRTGELERLEQENERLKAELKKYEDMAKKGLDEFKDVGGCWGCGIQESLNQAWADCKNYRQALQEIKDIVSEPCVVDENCQTCNSGCMQKDILAKINEVIGAE